MKILKNQFVPVVVFLLILLLTILVYFPGLKGGFLFDDYPNLSVMAIYGDMSNWSDALRFVINGHAGPTGRPVSLITFVPQATDWFANNPVPFKVVNLIIHLLCGFLLFCVIQILLRAYGEKQEQKIKWIALLAASFWLLHPLMLSTTLYVIQRMAQLPLLFSLIAMVGYFKGRVLLNTKPYTAYVLMTTSIGLGTLLATFSKENGALLPLLILVIEFCNPNKLNRPAWQWRAICLWLPSIAIVVMLLHYIDFSDNPWKNRNFNQIERLWSEARIVCGYLVQLFIPRVEGDGFFQDGYTVSKSWLSPVSTLVSVVFLFFLLVVSFLVRKKHPLVALAILFFFAAHLMESTFIGLELYFEHRNYIAAIFIFLPLATGLYALSEQSKPSIGIFVSVLIIVILAVMTWQRSILWADTIKLQLFWAQNNPNSARAQNMIAKGLAANKQYEESNQFLEKAIKKSPNSGMLAFRLLLHKVVSGQVVLQDFVVAKQRVEQQQGEPQAIQNIQEVVFKVANNPKLTTAYGDSVIAILDALLGNPSYKSMEGFEAIVIFLKGYMLLAQHKPAEAYMQFEYTLQLSRNITDGLNMVAALGNAGYRQLGLNLLGKVKEMYQQLPDSKLQRSREYYTNTIHQLQYELKRDLQIELKATMEHS